MNKVDVLRAMVIDSSETIAEIQREIERAKERLAIEERFTEELRRRLRQVERTMGEESARSVPTIKTGDSLNGDALTGDEPTVPEDKSIPERIAALLQSTKQPMRARDIAEAIGSDNPSVLSALGRRKDLFQSVSRGIYRIREAAAAAEAPQPKPVEFGK